MAINSLKDIEIEQYSRQLIVKGWSKEKQLRLMNSTVLIEESLIFSAFYLASAGVKKISILKNNQQKQNNLFALLRTIHPDLELKYLGSTDLKNFDWAILENKSPLQDGIKNEIRIAKFNNKRTIKFGDFEETFELNNTGISFVDNLACSLIIREIFAL